MSRFTLDKQRPGAKGRMATKPRGPAQNWRRSGLVGSATLLVIAAGMVHLSLTPLHWAHAPTHGLFFAMAGSMQIAWGVAFWRRPSVNLHHTGIVMACWLITLWLITRLMPAPFGHEPEAVEIYGLACLLLEVLAIATLVGIAMAQAARRAMRVTAWRNLGVLLVVALLAGWLTYGAGLAAEPLLPQLEWSAEHGH